MNTPTLGIVFQIIGTQDQPTPFELGSGGSTYKQARGRERAGAGEGEGGEWSEDWDNESVVAL